MRRKTRKLSADDKAIWSSVAETLTPLRTPVSPKVDSAGDSGSQGPAKPPPGPLRADGRSASPRPAPRRHVAAEPHVRISLAPDPMAAADDAPPRMDSKAYGRLKRGKLAPEARIDLHGMTAERAHGALRGFVMDSHARGLRLVLVITGKGRSGADEFAHTPTRRGVLRNAVPVWLAQPPLNTMVLQLSPAHPRHGGGGAYYIYLRRRR